jgi:tetratricopeptide (TPR) repeat protein
MLWIGGQLDQALDHYLQALEIQKELQSKKEIAISLSNIGTVYCVKGNYSKGIDYFNQSLVLQEELGDKGELARTWNNLGSANFLIGESTRALEAFEHSLRLNREIGATLEVMMNLFNLTEAMFQACKLQDTMVYLKEGAALAEKSDDVLHRSRFAWMTGRLMLRMGFYEDAEKKLGEALADADTLNNKSLQLPCHLALAGLYLELKETDKAQTHQQKAGELAQAIGDSHAMFHVSLIELKMNDTDGTRKQARELLHEHDTPREDALLESQLAYLSLDQGNVEQAETHLQSAGEFFDVQREDIDYVRFLLIAGKCAAQKGDGEKAMDCLGKAADKASQRKLLPEHWQAAAELSEIAFERKDFEQSFAYARQATESLKKIAGKIRNSDRLGRFYNHKKIVHLLGRIKSLQSVLSKTKKAVSQ